MNTDTTEETTVSETEKSSSVKIYSKKAIWGFSVFFTPVFGGILLRQNLIDCQKIKEANMVLLASTGFTILTILITNSMEKTSSLLTFGLNMAGGAILSEYFFKKYFPEDDYEYKKIWKALLISVLITIPFLLAILYAPAE